MSTQEYRGWKIESYEGTNVGYNIQTPGRGTGSRAGKGRQVNGFTTTSPYDGYEKIHDTLRAAKKYIDDYEGEAKGFRRVTANVGEIVIWNSRTGPTEAEFRGQTMGMDGYEATIIVREEGKPPFQITVDADQIKKKSMTIHKTSKPAGRLLGKQGEGFVFAVSTEAPDRDGDTVDQSSINWKEFDQNPVATLSHDTEVIPVGKWLPESRKITEVEDPATKELVRATVMTFVPNPHTKAGQEVGASVADDFLSGASISFLPDEDRTEKNAAGGSHYEEVKVTEVAVCAVPANQGATRRAAMLCKSLSKQRKNTNGAKPMKIKFWRHKTNKGHIRCLRKDMAALLKAPFFTAPVEPDKLEADDTGNQLGDDRATQLEPLDQEPKAGEMGDWDQEEMELEPDPEQEDKTSGLLQQILALSDDDKSKLVTAMKDAEAGAKSEDLAADVADRAGELEQSLADGTDDEDPTDTAVDAAIAEKSIPEGLRKAVKLLALKRMKAAKQLPQLTKVEAKLKDHMADCVSRKVSIFMREHPDWDKDHVLAAAYGYCGEKAIKSGTSKASIEKVKVLVLKELKSKSFKPAKKGEGAEIPAGAESEDQHKDEEQENQPHGLKMLRKWAKMLDEDLGTMHKSEHQHVMDAADKALTHFGKAATKAYDYNLSDDLQKELPAAHESGDDEEIESEEKDMTPVVTDNGKWTIFDPTSDEYVGEFESEEQARNGINEMARADLPEERAKQLKSLTRRKANRRSKTKTLNKATKATIGDAVEFMEGCSESKDLPKHLKSGHKHHAVALKALIEAKQAAEETPNEDEMDAEASEVLAKTLASAEERMENLDASLYAHYGRQYRPVEQDRN